MNLSKQNFYSLSGIIAALIFFIILWIIPQLQTSNYREKFSAEDIQKLEPKDRIQLEKNAADIENSSRLTLAQIIGGLALLAGLYFTYQNVRAAQDNAKTAQETIKISQENLRVMEEGKLTDRFSKAVEMLGGEKLDVRLGGIYALERIALDSQKDHWTVMEVLTAFVRENSHRKIEQNSEHDKLREDIQAVMSVIGRRKWSETEKQSINLASVNLRYCNLNEANLGNAILDKVILSEANLSKAILTHTNLCEAILCKSDLSEASLNYAYLFKADLSKSNLRKADFSKADLKYSNLTRVKLSGTNLSGADVKGVEWDGVYSLTLEQILSTEDFDYYSLPSDLQEQYKELRAEQAEVNLELEIQLAKQKLED